MNFGYTISDKSMNLALQIADIVGQIRILDIAGKNNLKLRRANRLRSIQSSIAIEANSLSLEQVSDVIAGKKVLGSPREILEAKNAFAAYEKLPDYNPYNVKDFLRAHDLMAGGLLKSAGHFRSHNVGVFAGDELIHAGANPEFVPRLVDELFAWARETEVNYLIKSSIVHFEIEFIHPFADGNGRMGRLWQTLILAKFADIFAWLTVENLIYDHQQEYYDALGQAQRAADSGVFIEFMLKMILAALKEYATAAQTIVQETEQETEQVARLLQAMAKFSEKYYSARELMAALGLAGRPNFVKNYLKPALDGKLIERKFPDKPSSRNQKYRLVRG